MRSILLYRRNCFHCIFRRGENGKSSLFCERSGQSDKESKINKIDRLFDVAGFGDFIKQDDLTAIKVHFGERGTDVYMHPIFVRKVVEKVKCREAIPFITDTNTLIVAADQTPQIIWLQLSSMVSAMM